MAMGFACVDLPRTGFLQPCPLGNTPTIHMVAPMECKEDIVAMLAHKLQALHWKPYVCGERLLVTEL
jgi:hypothetical protein